MYVYIQWCVCFSYLPRYTLCIHLLCDRYAIISKVEPLSSNSVHKSQWPRVYTSKSVSTLYPWTSSLGDLISQPTISLAPGEMTNYIFSTVLFDSGNSHLNTLLAWKKISETAHATTRIHQWRPLLEQMSTSVALQHTDLSSSSTR